MQKPYKFSVVMAVYNVAPFIREAVDSLIEQSIGFDQIQLILVDDGSTDESGRICDEYAQKYPENVEVHHKKNGGVSSARNCGLEYVKGQYVNFMDPDDKISPEAFLAVYRFFEQHKEETDVVSIPILFFDARTGEHMLNDKYKRGTRIIDLDDEPYSIQLHVNSTFVSVDAANKERMDERLSISEDAKYINTILMKKRKLGVVTEGEYLYRKRSTGQDSALDHSILKAKWYLPCLEHFWKDMIRRSVEEYGTVPIYLQYVLAYDMSWRFRVKEIPKGVISPEEKDRYLHELVEVSRKIDDDVWLEQRYLSDFQKAYILKSKYSEPLQFASDGKDGIDVLVNGRRIFSLSESEVIIHRFALKEQAIEVEGEMYVYPELIDDIQMEILVNGRGRTCEHFTFREPQKALGGVIRLCKSFTASFPLRQEGMDICFAFRLKGDRVRCTHVTFRRFVPVSKEFESSYCWKNGWKITPVADGFRVCRSDRKDALRSEIRFCKELWKANSLGSRKAVVLRTLSGMAKKLVRKPVWLISDRINKADDNGEAFFRYMREHHRKEVNCYYVLSKQSADFQRLRKIGPVVDDKGFLHKILFFCSQYNISAQADDITQNPFMGYEACYQDKLCDEQFIFLQHGVIKDDLSGWLNRYNKNIRGFVTSAPREKESIVRGNYLYTDKEVWLTGMPRYDRLYHDEKRRITIMPTWRRYLMSQINQTTGVWNVGNKFEQSEYYQFYNALLNDERLLKAAQEYKYQICFFPHPNVQALIDRFDRNDQVQFLRIDAKYREVYAESDLVVTDYSSAVFDFAYLRKPIVYCQFDAKEFFGGEHVYQSGYFDYERDGFGEVEHDLEGTVKRIIEYMRSDCQLKDKYRKRIDGFFAYHDQNNCERVYNKLIEASKG